RGFQAWGQKEIQLAKDEVREIRLLRAPPTSGIVVTPEGVPIAGAKIRCALEVTSSSNSRGNSNDQGPVLATTDASGHFTLDSFNEGAQYALVVDAGDHGKRLFTHIYAGQSDLRFVVGPDLRIRGRVIGDLAKLAREKDKPIIRYNQQPSVQTSPDMSYGLLFQGKATVEISDDGGHFEITGLIPGPVWVTAGQRIQEFKPTEPLTDVTIDLDAVESKPTMRRVVIRFVDPQEKLSPTGRVRLYVGSRERLGLGSEKRVDIHDGAVEVDSYAPGYVHYDVDNVVGYWFQSGAVDVQPGEGAVEHNVEILPAGAVRGRVLNVDGSPATDALITSSGTLHWSPSNWSTFGTGHVPTNSAGEFFLSPLPFGTDKDWVIRASRGNENAISAPVHVDEEQISPSVELKFSPKASAAGVVLDKDGQPRGGVSIYLEFRHPDYTGGYRPGRESDRRGRFTFEGLSTGIGEYWATVQDEKHRTIAQAKLNPAGEPVRLVLPD
ncbi:MAG: hypothetical protein ABUL64_03295, partial [Singulisphaera sp.]